MKTAVVILNWNTSNFLEKYVPGILHSIKGLDAELIVADSASTDDSMEMMKKKCPEVKLIELSRNYGFTGGYDRALSQVDAEYYVLLNSDIEVQDGWLQPLIRTLDEHPDIGACTPKLHSWFNRDMFEYAGAAGGYIDYFGFPFCRGRVMNMVEKDNGQYDTPTDVFWASGACLMVRSKLFHNLSGLDDRFFAHMEEIDLCWKMQLAGFRIRVVPDSVVYHIGGGTLPSTSPWKLKLNYRNNLLLLENNLAKTLALNLLYNKYPTEENGVTHIAEKACRMTDRRIFMRMIIDGFSATVYLISGKFSFFKAVWQAHKEFRELSSRPKSKDIAEYLETHTNVRIHGIYDKCMIPRALCLKKRFFGIASEYFREHEKE